jgi:hypothetical protein
VGLISSGTSPRESAFLDASGVGGRGGGGGEGGGDVFFLTASQLVSGDVDQAFDVYDAHECGMGWACAAGPPPVAPPACSPGETCQGSSTPQPVFGVPASATFSGAGNLAPLPVPVVAKPKPRMLSRAEKLALALKACRKKPKGKRVGCERQARRAYGASRARKSGASSSRGGAR